jgi:quinol monooxygenase YgiN
MSVIMALRLQGDPKKFEAFAAANPDKMESIRNRAVDAGLIAHRFFGSSNGNEIVVVDEWPDEQTFQSFFEATAGEIQGMMGEAGIGEGGQPQPEFWHVLESQDKYGWGA